MSDRELLKMALNALDRTDRISGYANNGEVRKALRDRLKQPEQEQEPVAWMHKFIRDNIITHNPADIGRYPDRWTPLYTAPQPKKVDNGMA